MSNNQCGKIQKATSSSSSFISENKANLVKSSLNQSSSTTILYANNGTLSERGKWVTHISLPSKTRYIYIYT